VDEQLCPVGAQTVPVPQVPLVAPGGTSQESPAQQSALMVQAPLMPTQGETQVPALQLPEQQSVASEQATPFTLQVAGGWHEEAVPLTVQESGAQQDGSSAPVQVVPVGLQFEVAVQRSTPPASGTQGAELQH